MCTWQINELIWYQLWLTYLREQLTLLWRSPPDWLMFSFPVDVEKRSWVSSSPALDAGNVLSCPGCNEPPTPHCASLCCPVDVLHHQPNTSVSECVWVSACVREQEERRSRGWTENGLGSSCFPSPSIFTPPPLSSSTSLCLSSPVRLQRDISKAARSCQRFRMPAKSARRERVGHLSNWCDVPSVRVFVELKWCAGI